MGLLKKKNIWWISFIAHLPGRGPMFILPPRTARRMIRKAEHSPRIIVGELQRKVPSRGHQVSKTTIRCCLHANKLFGRHPRRKPYLTTNVSAWSSPSTTGTLTGTVFYGQVKWKLSFSATNTQNGFWHKRKKAYNENNLYVSMVEVEILWCCEAVFPPKALGTLFGYMASWTPWNSRKL